MDGNSRGARRAANRLTPLTLIAAAALAVGAMVVSGCAGDGPPVSTSSTTTSTVPGGSLLGPLQQQVFTPSCATSGCHDAITSIAGLDLSSTDDSYNELVGVASLCAGKLRVVPGDIAASYLVDKVGDGDSYCGSLMPLGLPALDSDELQLLRDWIAQGAPPAGSNSLSATSTTDVSNTTATTGSTTTTVLAR